MQPPLPVLPTLPEEGDREVETKVVPGKKGGVVGRCWFKFVLTSHYLTFIDNKLIEFPQVNSVLQMTVTSD